MHKNGIGILLAAVVCTVIPGYAATPASTIARESLISADIINRLSVGVDFTDIDRGVQRSDLNYNLKAKVFDGYVGYDVVPWLTVFFTLGGCQLDYGEEQWSSGTKWSVGAAPNIWEGDFRYPTFLAGKVSISAVGEYGEYESSVGEASVSWREMSAVLFFRYEIFEDAPWSAETVTSLRFSVGPAVSKVSVDVSGVESGFDGSFDEKETVGWMASLEWFLAPTLSLSGGVEAFDRTSVSGSIRLHF